MDKTTNSDAIILNFGQERSKRRKKKLEKPEFKQDFPKFKELLARSKKDDEKPK